MVTKINKILQLAKQGRKILIRTIWISWHRLNSNRFEFTDAFPNAVFFNISRVFKNSDITDRVAFRFVMPVYVITRSCSALALDVLCFYAKFFKLN